MYFVVIPSASVSLSTGFYLNLYIIGRRDKENICMYAYTYKLTKYIDIYVVLNHIWKHYALLLLNTSMCIYFLKLWEFFVCF